MAKEKAEDKEVFLSEIDPADGSDKYKDETLDGTTSENLPEAPVDPAAAAALLAQRAYEADQSKQAEIPDPDKKDDK